MPLENMDRKALRDLLCKNWMTHDAMWFFHCAQAVGVEKTNLINKAAVAAMGQIEAKRLLKALGMEKVDDFAALCGFVDGTFDLIGAEFMKFSYSFPAENTLLAAMEDGECFAYKGIKRIGAIDQYDCGIYTRVEAWLDALGVRFTVEPQFKGCLMHQRGSCRRTYRLEIPAAP